MEKSIILAALLLVCFSGVTNAQTRKQREDAKREHGRKNVRKRKPWKLSRTLYPTSKQLML